MKASKILQWSQVEGASSTIFFPFVVSTGTGAIGTGGHRATFWWLYHSKEALRVLSLVVHSVFLAQTLPGHLLDFQKGNT